MGHVNIVPARAIANGLAPRRTGDFQAGNAVDRGVVATVDLGEDGHGLGTRCVMP